MDKKITVVYDEHDEDYMYPLPGESDSDYKKRLKKLREKLDATMTEEDRLISAALAKGFMPPELIEEK